MTLVAVERFWSNKMRPVGRLVTNGTVGVPSTTPQRRRITVGLRADVVEAYESGQTSRRVAEELALGRTTVLKILKDAGVPVRPQGRKY